MQYSSPWTCWRLFDSEDCDLQRGRWRGLLLCCASFQRSTITDIMDTSGYSAPIREYQDNAHKMRVSHDEDRSNPKNLYSLGVVDLDLSLSPDTFGLLLFDSTKPLMQMLPGSSPCELRLMLPDSKVGTEGFHDMLIDNLSTSPAWWSNHVSPADITALRRRWPKALFRIMQRHAKEVERLRRFARRRTERAFRHSAPSFCPICQVKIESALDVHMINSHLELGQLWRSPVEWCAVWKDYVSDCLGHLHDKHGGFFALKNVAKFFPPWTVTRDVWQAAIRPDVSGIAVDARLFHETACRLVHRCRVYKDPFPHPALRGGGGGSPRFMEWIRVPESASLLEMGPGRWLNALSRDKAMAAAIQLHRDVCLMTTNLDILDQYALSLPGTASKMLEKCLGSSDFPSADVAAGVLGPRVHHASVQIEAMGLWRPSLDPILLA